MRYFHRTSVTPDEVVASAAVYFGSRMTPTDESPRRRRFTSVLGEATVSVQAEGGHYTLVVVDTNQPGESELDRVAKRFLSTIHAAAHGGHVVRGAY